MSEIKLKLTPEGKRTLEGLARLFGYKDVREYVEAQVKDNLQLIGDAVKNRVEIEEIFEKRQQGKKSEKNDRAKSRFP